MFFAPALRSRAFVAPRHFDRNFERFVNDAFVGARRNVDVQEDEKGWTLRLDVPGIAREQLSIGIEGAVVRKPHASTKRPMSCRRTLTQPPAKPSWNTAF